MEHIPAMNDLAYSADEKAEKASKYGAPCADGDDPIYSGPDYPYGLSLCLSERELRLAGLDGDDIDVGDILHGHFFAKVTSVSADASKGEDGEDSTNRRVELTITHLSGEDEDEENEEEDARDEPGILDKLYG